MYKYDEDDATAEGEFTDGNPLLNIGRTILRSWWNNMVQRELLSLVTSAGLTPIKNSFTQVYEAVRAIAIDWGKPTGEVSLHYGTLPPTSHLECDGSIKNRADHPRLWAYAQANGVIVTDTVWNTGITNRTLFSSGNGTTTFRMPDLRGLIGMGWDHGRGIDPGRALGSYEPPQVGGHTHLMVADQTNGAALDNTNAPVRRRDHNSPSDYIMEGGAPTIGKSASNNGTAENRVATFAAMIVMKT